MKYCGVTISNYTIFLGIYFFLVILGVVDIGIGIGSVLKYIALFPILFATPKVSNIRLNSSNKFILIYYLFAILSYSWAINEEEASNNTIAFISFMLLFLSTLTQHYNKAEISFLQKCLLWSGRLSVIVAWALGIYSEGRLIIRHGVINEDPNYLCAYFYFGIAYCLKAIFENKKLGSRLFYILELLIYLYTIFATGSRGGLLGALVIAIVVLMKCADVKSFKGIVSMVLTVCVLYVLVGGISSGVDTDVMNRFSAESISESDGSGRYEIWEDAINSFMKFDFFHTLFGYGMGTSRSVAQYFHFSRINVMHNVVLENMIGLGIIGVMLYLICLYSFHKLAKCSVIALSLFWGMFALTLSTSILYLKPYWNALLFISIASIYKRTTIK